ncbi:MAG: hypothetical protein KJZ69_15760 [Phycisphaerales bacterium]|nr:hypothetical protein [Phycisphaerales bacterium]
MITYHDTGADEGICPATWFDTNLVQGIAAFRGQFGFFKYGAIAKFASALGDLAVRGGRVRLVLGSNATDPLTVADVRPLVSLFAGSPDARLTVVSFGNALFHPKVAHIVRANHTATGIVGSANLTVQALGTHVEAWIELEGGSAASDTALGQAAAAIDRWAGLTGDGAFQIASEADISMLLAQGIILERSLPRSRPRPPEQLGLRAQTTRGNRRTRWRPPVPQAIVEADLDVAPEDETEPQSATSDHAAVALGAGTPATASTYSNFAMVLAQFDVSHRTGVPGTPEMSLPGDVEPFFGPLGFDSKNKKHAGRHFFVEIETPQGVLKDEYRAWRREAGEGGNADFRFRVSHELVDMTDPAGGDILHVQRHPGSNPEYHVRLVKPTSPEYAGLHASCSRSGGTGGAAGQKRYGLW